MSSKGKVEAALPHQQSCATITRACLRAFSASSREGKAIICSSEGMPAGSIKAAK